MEANEPIEKELTDKQKRFVEEYVIDSNGTQAAIRAGYAAEHAHTEASRLLRNVKVSAYLAEKRKEIADKLQIDAAWVLQRFVDISNRCMQAEPVLIFDGEQWVESGEYKFDATGANKATESIGKHLGFFEKDNDQSKTTITIPPINVYSGTVPLASSESEIEEIK